MRHAGEGVALIVAQTRAGAIEAAELVAVDYEPLPAVVDAAGALAKGAPTIWDEAPGNVCADGGRGDKAAVDAAFARAAHVTRMEIKNNRVTGLPLEPAAAIGLYDESKGGYTLRAGSQGILIQKRALCGCFSVGEDKVRVICRDVGGGFGTKNLIYREYVLVCWAARKVGRPVKWRGERSEAFFFDPYGRDLVSTTELALDKDGKFLAIRTHNIQNLGSQTAPSRAAGARRRRDQRRLRYSRGVCAARGGVHQHRADLDLSRRRTAGGHLHHRAADRHGGGRDGNRPHRAAAEEFHPAGDAALRQLDDDTL